MNPALPSDQPIVYRDHQRGACWVVVWLACLVAFIIVATPWPPLDREALLWLAGSGLAAFGVVRLYPYPVRAVGLVLPGVLLLFASSLWLNATLVGAGLGMVLAACLPRLARRGNASSISPRYDRAIAIMLAVLLFGLMWFVSQPRLKSDDAPNFPAWLAPTLAGVLVVVTTLRLFRSIFELFMECVVGVQFRVRSGGPIDAIPRTGPLIVIANHACYWDPLFLAKVIPRPITPMMTSNFYDLWFFRPLMVYVFHAIRVPDAHARREAPELAEAIAALDAGQCVVIFPEAFLRRKEELLLRRFGRGIHEILKLRPQTPVVCCWIEGNWGSYTSYFGGPPGKNKRPDLRRPIFVQASETMPFPISEPDHLSTRIGLMNKLLNTRAAGGIVPVPLFPMPSDE